MWEHFSISKCKVCGRKLIGLFQDTSDTFHYFTADCIRKEAIILGDL